VIRATLWPRSNSQSAPWQNAHRLSFWRPTTEESRESEYGRLGSRRSTPLKVESRTTVGYHLPDMRHLLTACESVRQ
jgi:hypothetical protein